MSNFNLCVLAGNLTTDPDLKYTPSGTPICKFTLAINSFYKNDKGEKNEVATFIPIECWRRQAETCAEHLSKGRPVLVEGRIRQDKWTDKEGKKRSRLFVNANLVRFLGVSPKADNAPPRNSAAEDDTDVPIENEDEATQ